MDKGQLGAQIWRQVLVKTSQGDAVGVQHSERGSGRADFQADQKEHPQQQQNLNPEHARAPSCYSPRR